MEIFRIATAKYADKLTASGGSNRWNREGQFILYTASSRSLASLELVVHRASIQPLMDYRVMVISVADDDHLYKQIQKADLPSYWRQMLAYTALQQVGSEWYRSMEHLVLKVPSAVIEQEYNYLLNTAHPEFGKHVKLVRTEDYFWDSRLLQ